MAQLQTLPDAHTDFVLSVRWEGAGIWLLLFLLACGAVGAALAYRRHRRKRIGPDR